MISVAGVLFLIALALRLLVEIRRHSKSARRYDHILVLYRAFIVIICLSTATLFAQALSSTEVASAMRLFLSEAG